MTINEIIELVDHLKPNQFESDIKIRWLSTLDRKAYMEVMQTHEHCHIRHFKGYTNDDVDTELLIPEPFADDIYTAYLMAQIDRENGEMNKYNQSITRYNSAYLDWCNYYNRKHRPRPARTAFVL